MSGPSSQYHILSSQTSNRFIVSEEKYASQLRVSRQIIYIPVNAITMKVSRWWLNYKNQPLQGVIMFLYI
jgi:hypothetical protein